VTRVPDFDDLVGEELEDAERARLRRVHELLVAAGPPPELSPELEADMLATYRKRGRDGMPWRRTALLAAAVLALAAAFFGGYVSGNDSKPAAAAFAPVRVVALNPTAEAPSARALLGIGRRDQGGNWPMRLTVTGLPNLHGTAYYGVFLTDAKGKVTGYCGSFLVRDGEAIAFLNAPYELADGAGWIVTVQHPGDRRPGPVVLRT
jgi:hypothetical protein